MLYGTILNREITCNSHLLANNLLGISTLLLKRWVKIPRLRVIYKPVEGTNVEGYATNNANRKIKTFEILGDPRNASRASYFPSCNVLPTRRVFKTFRDRRESWKILLGPSNSSDALHSNIIRPRSGQIRAGKLLKNWRARANPRKETGKGGEKRKGMERKSERERG